VPKDELVEVDFGGVGGGSDESAENVGISGCILSGRGPSWRGKK
jgi:hypothetical protein